MRAYSEYMRVVRGWQWLPQPVRTLIGPECVSDTGKEATKADRTHACTMLVAAHSGAKGGRWVAQACGAAAARSVRVFNLNGTVARGRGVGDPGGLVGVLSDSA